MTDNQMIELAERLEGLSKKQELEERMANYLGMQEYVDGLADGRKLAAQLLRKHAKDKQGNALAYFALLGMVEAMKGSIELINYKL